MSLAADSADEAFDGSLFSARLSASLHQPLGRRGLPIHDQIGLSEIEIRPSLLRPGRKLAHCRVDVCNRPVGVCLVVLFGIRPVSPGADFVIEVHAGWRATASTSAA